MHARLFILATLLLSVLGFSPDAKADVRDHLGSTRAVIDEAGELLQTVNYYASGVPFTLTQGETATDRLHSGKQFIDHQGLGYYDNSARMYDVLGNRFTTLDPMATDYGHLSPYTYCAGNPLKYTDPTGMYLVDDKGKPIHYDNKTQTWSKNATPDVIEIGNALMLTLTGTKALNRMILAKHPISIKIRGISENNTFGRTSSDFYKHKDKSGNVIGHSFYQTEIIISKENIESFYKETKYRNLSTNEIIGVTATHEAVHATNIKAVSHLYGNEQAEKLATLEENKFIKELEEQKPQNQQ